MVKQRLETIREAYEATLELLDGEHLEPEDAAIVWGCGEDIKAAILSAEDRAEAAEAENRQCNRHLSDALAARDEFHAAKRAAEAETARLSALLDQAREVVSWALPFANQALEEHRVERLRCGHGDIGAERGTDIGLWDNEVETRDAARTFLNSLSKRGEEGDLQTNVEPQCADPQAGRSGSEG